jgi:hypothetical protein
VGDETERKIRESKLEKRYKGDKALHHSSSNE